jgi:hypothetical protein
MTKNLNVGPLDVASITRQRKLRTSNKISKGIVGSSLKYPRPLLGRPTFLGLAGPTLARLAAGSLRCWGEAAFAVFR